MRVSGACTDETLVRIGGEWAGRTIYSIVPVWPVRSLFPRSISSEVPKSEIIALGLIFSSIDLVLLH